MNQTPQLRQLIFTDPILTWRFMSENMTGVLKQRRFQKLVPGGVSSFCSLWDQSRNKQTKKSWLKTKLGFPGGAVVENLPANAGDTGSSPGLGRSHMPRSNWAHEPQLLNLRVWSLCPAMGGAAIVRGPRTTMKSGPRTTMKSGPRLPQLEKALARNEDPTQLKINK